MKPRREGVFLSICERLPRGEGSGRHQEGGSTKASYPGVVRFLPEFGVRLFQEILPLNPMSAPLAGKFQDHYEVLGIDPKADVETIQQAYSALAKKFHPGNAVSGDAEAFEAVNMAYEVLSDPPQRHAFDNLKGSGEDMSCPSSAAWNFSIPWGVRLAFVRRCCVSSTIAGGASR